MLITADFSTMMLTSTRWVCYASSIWKCWNIDLISKKLLKSRVKQLRLEAKLSQNHLARLSDLDRATIAKAEKGAVVSELTLHKVASALSEQLGRTLEPDELVGY